MKETMTENYYQKLFSLDALSEFWLFVDRISSERTLGGHEQFPQLPEAVYLYSFMGSKALLEGHIATATVSSP